MTATPVEREAEGTWTRLRRRKVVQWGVAYAAGAWALLEVLGFATDAFAWPAMTKPLAMLGLAVGLPIVVALAWYHGDRGQQRVTGTELAVLALLLFLGGGLLWWYAQRSVPTTTTTAAVKPAPASAATDARPSIAVLPFDNRSKLEDDAYFVDGIHDDILTQLSKVSALKVISRTSVERFRDTKLPLKDIAQQLGVNSILEGGVQRAGDRVRIHVQLIDAASDGHLWAESYDRELTAVNIFAIQSEVASAISGALKAALTPAEQARVAAIPTRNLRAWESYQLGKQRMAKRTSASLVDAEEFFKNAINLDPEFALAYVGLSDALMLQTSYSDAPWDATLVKAETAAAKALELDPKLAEAWASSAQVARYSDQFDRAETMYRRAIDLNPNYATAHQWFSGLLTIRGRLDEALSHAERAAALDPLSAIINYNLGSILELSGRIAEAEPRYRRAVAIDPAMPTGYTSIGMLDAYALNRFADAVPFLKKASDLDPGNPRVPLDLVMVRFDLGDVSEAIRLTQAAQRRWPDNDYVDHVSAFVYAAQGDLDAAVRFARKALEIDRRNPGALSLLDVADLKKGDASTARSRYAQAYPELLAPEPPKIDASNSGPAFNLVPILQQTGEGQRATLLLDRVEQVMRTTPRLGSNGYGIADVQIHALRGDKEKALAALREAEKAGWRGPLWRYVRDVEPALDSIRSEPEFKGVFADIERDMDQQRAELAKRPKDAPLDLAVVH